jgi:phage tail-like protein
METTPLLGNRYSIEIDNLRLADFTEISTVSIEVPAVEQKVAIGDGLVHLHSYPGVVKYGDITLKAGKVHNAAVLYDWLLAVVEGRFSDSLRNGTIIQLPSHVGTSDFDGDRWHFERAWPSKWEIPTTGAGKSEMVVESLTMKVGRIWRD